MWSRSPLPASMTVQLLPSGPGVLLFGMPDAMRKHTEKPSVGDLAKDPAKDPADGQHSSLDMNEET